MTEKQIEKIAAVIVMFTINIIIFLISMVFTDISLSECLIYSTINGIWMAFILSPLLLRKNKSNDGVIDFVQNKLEPLIVRGFRNLGQQNGRAPTHKTSDKKIIEIYKEVCKAFIAIADERVEHIPSGYLNTIVFKFLQVYEMTGEAFYKEHLEYEINKYKLEGLRSDYQKNLSIV